MFDPPEQSDTILKNVNYEREPSGYLETVFIQFGAG